MAQYIGKDALVEWLINLKIEYGYNWNFAIDTVLKHINNLEVKEVDLEKEIENWMKYNEDDNGYFNTFEFAKHFFELGLKVNQKGE